MHWLRLELTQLLMQNTGIQNPGFSATKETIHQMIRQRWTREEFKSMSTSTTVMHLLSALRETQFEQYRAQYLDPKIDIAFAGVINTSHDIPEREKCEKLLRHHHRQVLVDRITYHLLRQARHSHEATVQLMKPSASTSRPPSVSYVIRTAKDIGSAILWMVGEPEDIRHGYDEFSDRTFTYFKAFLTADYADGRSTINFRCIDHYVNYFKAMMAAGVITIYKSPIGDEEATRIGNQLIEEDERAKGAKGRGKGAKGKGAKGKGGDGKAAMPSTSQETERYEEYECVVCMDCRPSVRIMPCKHQVVCSGCFTELMKTTRMCPICRSDIDYSN